MTTTLTKKSHTKPKPSDQTWITLSDGVRLAAKLWLPTTAEKNPVGAVLDYGAAGLGDAAQAANDRAGSYFAENNLAFIRVAPRGTGNSEGLPFEEYSKDGQDDGLEIIAWLARQPWSNGNVGMMGQGSGGFSALQLAARRPPALKAIISCGGSDDRYEDDQHYEGGSLLTRNLSHGVALLAQLSLPPDPSLTPEKWRKTWLARLSSLSFQPPTWLQHANRDSYWRQGSVCENIGAIEVPVLLVGGWWEVNSNAIPRLMKSLRSVRKAIIGPWAGAYPHLSPEPLAIGFLQEALRWWQQWLGGEETGIKQEEDFRYFLLEAVPPSAGAAQITGRWRAEPSWGMGLVDVKKWYLTETGIAGVPGTETSKELCSPTGLRKAADAGVAPAISAAFFADQAEDDAHALIFDTPALKAPIVIIGQPLLEFEFMVDRAVAHVSVALHDIWPDGKVSCISQHIQNLCQRDGREAPSSLVPGRRYRVKIKLSDCAWELPTHHRLRVAITTTHFPKVWPAAEPVTLTFFAGPAMLHLPLHKHGGEEKPVVWPAPATASPVIPRELRSPATKLERQSSDTRETLTITQDHGCYETGPDKKSQGAISHTTYRITPGDPLSAEMTSAISQSVAQGETQITTKASGTLKSNTSHWQVSAKLEAYLGEELIFTKDFAEEIERRLL